MSKEGLEKTMFLESMGSTDPRFKKLEFHEGMNLLLAEKTDCSESTDSRNGAGKTSMVRLLRYLLGGRRDDWIKSLQNELYGESLWIDIEGKIGTLRVERKINSGEVIVGQSCYGSNEWSKVVGRELLGFATDHEKPTAAQVFSHLVRTNFESAVQTNAYDGEQACGARIGYYLGMNEESLSKAESAASFEKNKKALKKAVKEGAIGGLGPDKAECEAELIVLEKEKAKLESNLGKFKVDESYSLHQQRADSLSKTISELNDRGIVLRRRKRELEDAISDELGDAGLENVSDRVGRLYQEIGILLPETAVKSFKDVVHFHESVSKNRKLFLDSELAAVSEELQANQNQVKELDRERSELLTLLNKSMALEAFMAAQQDLSDLDSRITAMKLRIKDFERLDDMDSSAKLMRVEASNAVRTEMKEREASVRRAMSLFASLGEEIYGDRKARLLFDGNENGILKVTPKIDGDASRGITEVSIFLFDIVCVIVGLENGTLPGFLVHDSQLFDSMDDRQLASCLCIGARLSEEHGFQYIVTLNTDRLLSAEKEGFDRGDYPLSTVLTDRGETGGLFGFRFD